VDSFEARRAARAAWQIRRVSLREEPLSDARDRSSVDERIARVWRLTKELWAFANLPMPTYERAEMPGRIVRPE
jgi:hypothetical protein